MKKLLYLSLFFILITACTSVTPLVDTQTVAPTQVQGAIELTSYPIPAEPVLETPNYPIATPTAEPVVLPTRDPALSQVSGRLLLNNTPVTDGLIYLSKVIQDDGQKEIAVMFDRMSAYRGELDDNGEFLIMNVPPGRYGVIYDLVTNAYLLNEPDSEFSFLVEVFAGQDIDLGDLNYPNLPE